jgi:ABC-type branched-subunit amino acid transport system ATPase component/ABC-type branched-subunit amino acid transport system permease subunit
MLLPAVALPLIFNADGYYVFLVSSVAITAIVGVGLNVLLGLSGQISLGHAGFFAIGAYGVGILTVSHGWSLWLALPVAAAASALAGLVLSLPALRVQGPYLAMVTIAFGFVVEQTIAEAAGITGGWNGLSGIDRPFIGGLQLSERWLAAAITVTLAVCLAFYARLKASRLGLAMGASSNSEVAARSLGFRVPLLRTTAFVISAALTGLAGGYFAVVNSFISPESFPFSQSILFLFAVMIGGVRSTSGPGIGAVVAVFLPEVLSGFAQYRVLAVGVLLFLVLRLAPHGIAGLFPSRNPSAQRSKKPEAEVPPVSPLSDRDGESLRVSDVTVQFGGVRAVTGVSFEAKPGRITSIIGPNGAGKSTLVNLICGFYPPQAGTISLGEMKIAGLASSEIARHGVARTFQTTQLFHDLTVLQNVTVALRNGRLTAADSLAPDDDEASTASASRLLSLVGYRGDMEQLASALPHGDRRLVELARALAIAPRFLVLDEPAAGLNTDDTERLGKLLTKLAAEGTGVILIEHDMSLVMSVSDSIVVLDAGRKIAEGTPSEIARNPVVRETYLGSTDAHGDAVRSQTRSGRPAGNVILECEGLSSGYGTIPVLRDVTMHVHEGETVAVLGANGAGKSTLMKTLSGLLTPDDGRIAFAGAPLVVGRPELAARAGLSLVPEGRQVFPDLTVVDNILLGAFNRPSAAAREDLHALLQRFPKLEARKHQRAGLLSGGEQQMLAIARGLIARPRVLMLDEPSLGLAPLVVAEVYRLLAELKAQGLSLVVVDQSPQFALAIADRAYVLKSGRVAFAGKASVLEEKGDLIATYLGEGAAV